MNTESYLCVYYKVILNPQSSAGHFCGQVNQSIKYVHSCLKVAILIKRTNNPNPKSVVLEFCQTKPRELAAKDWFERRYRNH